MSTPTYDVDYFIRKFEALKDSEVGFGSIDDHCATWHCGVRNGRQAVCDPTPELKALGTLLVPVSGSANRSYFESVFTVNDGYTAHTQRLGRTPRARILAALNEIKAKGEK